MIEPEVSYGPVEPAVRDWLRDTDVAQLLTRDTNKVDIYMSMPKTAPNPVLLCRLIGGGPVRRADLPISRYRFQFDAIGPTRDVADRIARTLIGELEWLGRGGPGEVVNGVYLGAADIINLRWMPDPDTDTPRYIVDALITTVL